MIEKIQDTLKSIQNAITQLFDYYRDAYEDSKMLKHKAKQDPPPLVYQVNELELITLL